MSDNGRFKITQQPIQVPDLAAELQTRKQQRKANAIDRSRYAFAILQAMYQGGATLPQDPVGVAFGVADVFDAEVQRRIKEAE